MAKSTALSACRDSMVVRVYRRGSDGAAAAGIVEDPVRGTARAFRSVTELLELLSRQGDDEPGPPPADDGEA